MPEVLHPGVRLRGTELPGTLSRDWLAVPHTLRMAMPSDSAESI